MELSLSYVALTGFALAGSLSFQPTTSPGRAQEPLGEDASRIVHGGRFLAWTWGDCDGDGLKDPLSVTPTGRLRLLRNRGDGTFDEVTAQAGLASVRAARFALWADYDGDGRVDLFVGTAAGPSFLLRNAGQGVFEDVAETSGLTLVGEDRAAEWMDYDADGRPDLFLTTAEASHVYHAVGDGLFELVTLANAEVAWVPFGTLEGALEENEEEPGAEGTGTQPAQREVSRRAPPSNRSSIPLDRATPNEGRLPAGGGPTSASPPLGTPTGRPPFLCAESLVDQATRACLQASSIPIFGMLLPYPGIDNTFVAPAFVAGGEENSAPGRFAFVGGGHNNSASGDYAFVGGGGGVATTYYSTGTVGNVASGFAATVAGGRNNSASGDYAVVGGGGAAGENYYGESYGNLASGVAATVAGGRSNVAEGAFATVGGGGGDGYYNTAGNQALGDGSVVAGGMGNQAAGHHSSVAGGFDNDASGAYSTVAGGGAPWSYGSNNGWYGGNAASAAFSAVGGGNDNGASGKSSTVAGGGHNRAGGRYSTVGGGGGYKDYRSDRGNRASGTYSTVAGGSANLASGFLSTIGGGGAPSTYRWRSQGGNVASGKASMIAGGSYNTASGDYSFAAGRQATASGPWSTVGGGNYNRAIGQHTTIAGGNKNRATGDRSTVGGGGSNWASGVRAAVAGGGKNRASGEHSVVGGGELNDAQGNHSAIAGGRENTTSGKRSTVAGGSGNLAQGDFSFAAGRKAMAIHDGSFVWGDSLLRASTSKSSSMPDEFNVYASGGVRMFTNSAATTGVLLAPGGGSWSSVSDRDSKENLIPVDGQAVLDAVVAMPISTWNYSSQDDSVRHMGPMAQDFHAAFGLGVSDKLIDTVDPDGVALAAIQGLAELVREKDAEIGELRGEVARVNGLEAELVALRQQVAALVATSPPSR